MFTRIYRRTVTGYLLLSALTMLALGVSLGIALRADDLGGVVIATGAAGLLAVVIALGLAARSARASADALQRLTRLIHRLHAGDPDQHPTLMAQDEFGELARAVSVLASDLWRRIRALEYERAQLAAVLAHMADGVVITDRQGRIALVNPAAERLLLVPEARAQGRPIIEVLRDHELAGLIQESLAERTGPTQPRLVELTGLRRSLQVVASRIPDDPAGRVLLVFQDVTRLRQAETVRREFVANVSHELRTPVASLKALVETLEDGALDDPPAAREFVGRMHLEVDRLAQLIEELLELARLESGRVQFRHSQVDMEAVVRQAVERLRPQAERAGLVLTLEAEPGLPAVLADAARIE
ncbi:MAG: PAS domain-containing protein, partial [Chloroflexi bacterium]|nr:PAS domain-containing protein [Chloroflexota bacterium]